MNFNSNYYLKTKLKKMSVKDPNIDIIYRKAACGCFEAKITNSDPEFDGYETDREDEIFEICDEHKKVMKEIDRSISELQEQIYKIEREKKELTKKKTEFVEKIYSTMKYTDDFDPNKLESFLLDDPNI